MEPDGIWGPFRPPAGGTLLINGIQHTALQTQQLLLNVLQNGYYMPLGSSVHCLDVRMIATTTTDLYSLVLEGRFLDDLFFLLNTFSLNYSANPAAQGRYPPPVKYLSKGCL